MLNDQEPGTDQTVTETSAAEQAGTAQSDSSPQNTTNGPQNGSAQNGADDSDSAETAPKKPRARKQSTAKKTRTVELTLTVTGTADGEWQADLLHGGKRVLQGLEIPAAAVSKAAAELHDDISETIEGVLNAAREQHEAKLAELEAEVERVRKALAELEG